MNNEEREIGIAISKMLERLFAIPENLLVPENWGVYLTSGTFGLTAIDLVYLLFEIEKTYRVRLSEDCFDDHGFNSILGIAAAVYAATNHK